MPKAIMEMLTLNPDLTRTHRQITTDRKPVQPVQVQVHTIPPHATPKIILLHHIVLLHAIPERIHKVPVQHLLAETMEAVHHKDLQLHQGRTKMNKFY